MTFVKYISFLLLIFILVNCSSSVETSVTNNNSNTTKVVELENYNLSFNIPAGWNRIKDNYKKIFEVWLVSENKKSAIGLIPIHISKNELFGSREDKLKLVKSVTLSKKKTNADIEIISDEMQYFGQNVSEVRMLVNNTFQNSIIFGQNENFFECLAYFLEGYDPTEDEIDNLLADQAEFVKGCKIK